MSSDSENSAVHSSHKKRKKEKKHKKKHSYESEKYSQKRKKHSHKYCDSSSSSSISSRRDSNRKRRKHEHKGKKSKHSSDRNSSNDKSKTYRDDRFLSEKRNSEASIFKEETTNHHAKNSYEEDDLFTVHPKDDTTEHSDIASEIASLTEMLLEKFQSETKNKDTLLAKELYDLMNMVADGEAVCIDGIPDEELRMSLEKLFLLVGLIKEEMDDSESDDDNEQSIVDEVSIYGYALPEESDQDYQRILLKLNAVIGACKAANQNVINSQKRTIGPTLPPSDPAAKNVSAFDLEESEDDEIGPAPLGSAMNRKRSIKGSTIPTIPNLKSGSETNENLREEWMMTPGEHDFLSGVLAKGIKSRGFRNDKNASRISAPREMEHLDPKIQKEVDEIKKLHQEARGPSLIEQHREKKAEEKANKSVQDQGWTWSRDKHLDAGRKVDNSHLRMVMGGASSDLKSKFQGGYGRD